MYKMMKKYITTKLEQSRLLRAIVGGIIGGVIGSTIGIILIEIFQ